MDVESQEKLQEVTSNIENVDETMVELDEMSEEEEEGDEDVSQLRAKTDDGGSPDYEVPGVVKVVLDEDIQTSLGVIVGIDVTGEHPWKKISKELIVDNINSMMQRSPFAPLKKQINLYKEDEILVGYLLDETNDCDEFYVCLTTAAKEYCETVAEEFLQRQAKHLDESVVKDCGEWRPMGTEAEVDASIVKYSRPLIRIEIKTKFPIKNQTDRFSTRNANDVRDGYVELIPVKAVTDNLLKKRIDAQTQVTPMSTTSSAQTVPRFPKNIWTQCSTDAKDTVAEEKEGEEDDAPVVELSDHEKHKQEVAAKLAEKERELTVLRFKDFLYEKANPVERLLKFNSTVDIYDIDYPKLINNPELCKVEDLDFKELLVFSDKRTKNKYVSSVTWHPIHTQYVAVSYIDSIPSVVSYSSASSGGDEVKRAIYGENPVLVWSIFDSLKPKYYLESNSEVSVLCLCAFDENLLVGGCLNGQIVLWDANVLGEVETVEILTDAQEANRLTLYSGMTWMKKIHDRYVVRTTVASDVRTSHNGIVTDFSWISSHYEFNEFGKLLKLPADAPRSKQFLSCSHDGTILVWDLNLSAALEMKEKTASKSDDIPKELIFEKSPYKVLKGRFKPIFCIITGEIERNKFEPLMKMTLQFPLVNKLLHRLDANGKKEVYEDVNPSSQEGEDMHPIISLSTLYGEFLKLTSTSKITKDIVNSSSCEYESRAAFHGGIIVACIRNPFYRDQAIIATVGGNTIAIWQGERSNSPITWKVMKYFLKGASWSKNVPSQIYVLTDEGNIDIWDFLERSDMPVRSQILTGTFSTGVYPHTIYNKCIAGVADSSASLSVYSVPNIFIECNKNDIERTRKLFQREQEITDIYANWNDDWLARNPETIDRFKPTEKRPTLNEVKVKVVVPFKDDEEKTYGFHGAEISERLPPSLRRIEAGVQKWKRMQWEGVELAIQIRKALNKAELLFYEKPLRDVEAQKRSKRKKILDALDERNKIFQESVEILFPEAVPTPEPEPAIKSFEAVAATRKSIMDQYESLRKKHKSFVKHNPFQSSFSWHEQLSEGKKRCMHLDECAAIFAKLNEKIKNQIDFPHKKPAVVVAAPEKVHDEEGEEAQEEVEEMVKMPPAKIPPPEPPSPPPSPVLTDVDSDSDD